MRSLLLNAIACSVVCMMPLLAQWCNAAGRPVEVSTILQGSNAAFDGLSVGPDDNIYVSTGRDARVLRVTPSGAVSVFCEGLGGSANGSGFDSEGNLYVAAYYSNEIYKVTPDGKKTVFANGLDGPAGIWIDDQDYIFVSMFNGGKNSSVWRFDTDGRSNVYASIPEMTDVIGITGDNQGRIWVANWSTGRVWEVSADLGIQSVSGPILTNGNVNMIQYRDGSVYIPVVSMNHLVVKNPASSEVRVFVGKVGLNRGRDEPALSAEFTMPNAVAFSNDGTRMYVLERSGAIKKIEIDVDEN
ncbi:Vgb family protein [Gilvimarinus algae]|uniref:SMP-30/Gluconolactonase/LRE-like region domain-containing protein n=1 Tax=Gilvimarinus algae TaxID=3058037 RepID=A0ABT8T9W8_9GAMM|nr:hypothetical protein [Gilvimarinus sp. SDUM040014]MDO3380914.1 hypothetical protein [Gilvimarinus sp. SDUM040014]